MKFLHNIQQAYFAIATLIFI